MVIDSQELQYIFNNLTDDEKKNLPPHLKYIRQFKDYPKIEVDIKNLKIYQKLNYLLMNQ